MRRAVAGGSKRVVVQAPTGAGKTKLAYEFIEGALTKGNKAAFLVPYIALIDQTCESFAHEGLVPMEEFAVIQADHPWSNITAPLQICSIDTLAKRHYYPDVQVVVVDEAHRNSKFLWKWMDTHPDVVFIGLTATPWTKGMGKHWDQLIISTTTQELIDQQFLSPFRCYAPSSPDLEGIKLVAGEYHQGELGERVDKAPLIASIVETWLQRGEGRPTLLYAVNRAHAKHIQAEFIANGVNAGYVDAFTDRDERLAIQKAFHAGEIPVVCNVGVLVAGVDWDVRCVILAVPTRSEIKFVQMIGRGLRTADGKDDCLILDHSDTHNRLGFVTDIHHTSLDTGAEKTTSERAEPLPKPCPSCQFMLPPKTTLCPACGFKREAQSRVEVEDGELVEITGRKKTYTREEKEQIWAQLKWYAIEKGRKPGWIYHTCMEMCGSTPKNRDMQPMEPGMQVLNFIRHKQIQYAKKRGAKSLAA